jgi:hypothetical protein
MTIISASNPHVLPFLIIGPMAGVLVDRLNRYLVMIGSNIISVVALLAILLVGWRWWNVEDALNIFL